MAGQDLWYNQQFLVIWLCQTKQLTRRLAGTRRNTMSKIQTVVAEATLASQLAALGKDASQLALETIVKDHSVTDLVTVDHIGARISGSAERAIAALVNFRLADAMAAAGQHWKECAHRDTSELAKALAPMKTEFFTAHKGHSNPSTKWARIRVMGYELANPRITAPIGADGEGEEGAEGAAGNTSRTRDLYARYVVELGKLYRAGVSAENDTVIKNHPRGAEIVAALESVTAALKALGAPLDDEELKTFMAAQK
jgi:enamine deaminase RidA (YjgF/YER057c/UK114 family)